MSGGDRFNFAWLEQLERRLFLSGDPNLPPTAYIDTPLEGDLFRGGEIVPFTGHGTDPEDGELATSQLTWRVDLHHDDHVHPYLQEFTGAGGGEIPVFTVGEPSANIWFRIHLTVRDSSGLEHSAERDVHPRTTTLTIASNPPGMQLLLDFQPLLSLPAVIVGVEGMERTLSVQSAVQGEYQFWRWSDRGAVTHTIITPENDTTYLARFLPVESAVAVPLGAAARVSTIAPQSASNGLTVLRAAPMALDGRTSGFRLLDLSAADEVGPDLLAR